MTVIIFGSELTVRRVVRVVDRTEGERERERDSETVREGFRRRDLPLPDERGDTMMLMMVMAEC